MPPSLLIPPLLFHVEHFCLAHTFETPNADVKIEASCLQVSGILIVESRC
jgi:hypothetical protein